MSDKKNEKKCTKVSGKIKPACKRFGAIDVGATYLR